MRLAMASARFVWPAALALASRACALGTPAATLLSTFCTLAWTLGTGHAVVDDVIAGLGGARRRAGGRCRRTGDAGQRRGSGRRRLRLLR